MRIDGPRDLPDFRLWLVRQWAPDGQYTGLAVMSRRILNGEPTTDLEPELQYLGARQAALWWAAPDMATFVDRASRTLPPTTLTEDLLPDDHGIVAFAAPLVGLDAETGGAVEVNLMTWTRGVHVSRDRLPRECLKITSYKYLAGYPLGGGWVPLGSSNWAFDDDTDTAVTPRLADQVDRMASHSEDRRWLAALWLLAAQPITTTTVQRVTNKAKLRRLAKAKLESDVRLVDVRRQPARREAVEKGAAGHRNYTHRWLVGAEEGGFWRQQAHGPGWSLHKPLWIEPYEAGPKDKPLIVRDTVKVVKD